MGLNYTIRPPREELDSPNDFITVSLGYEELAYAPHDPTLIIDFENKQLDIVEETYRNLHFTRGGSGEVR